MPVIFDEANKIFNLKTPSTSYVLGIYGEKLPINLHYGNKIESVDTIENFLGFAPDEDTYGSRDCTFGETITQNMLNCELPCYGSDDYGYPLLHIKYKNGSRITKLLYSGHKIYAGKPNFNGLPSTYVCSDDEADTLELYLKDDVTGLCATLIYTAFNKLDVITRSVLLKNGGNESMYIERVLSGGFHLADNGYDYITFDGAWARERHITRTPLRAGVQTVESRFGASGHFHNPFMCIAKSNADENKGEVYGLNLVYSGNFVSGAEVSTMGRTRVFTGINPFDFEWRLDAGESFQSPEAVMCYSNEGFGKMSRTLHKLIRNNLLRGKYKNAERPVLLNNWEATYFNFNEEKIVNIAKGAAKYGIDLMVLDDGWFGKRNDDFSSLGDWTVFKEKLPNGIDGLAKKVNELGLKFGLWFEPEMISPDSELYRAHPDWCIHTEGRQNSLSRHQLVLDLSRADVREYIISALSKIFDEANIGYVKWDMNRNITEIGSSLIDSDRSGEIAHRYMLGLYEVLEKLMTKYPDILFEGCASGGGRFDMGMFYYFPQFWTSDDSDAIERQYIQHATSFAYPTVTMGAHVSAVPNHQVGRVCDIKTRGYVAMAGQFGYELDLATLTDEELEIVAKQVEFYKKYRNVFHIGDMYRIKSPFDGNLTVWEFVSENKDTVICEIFTKMAVPNGAKQVIRLKALDSNAKYKDVLTGKIYSGDILMNIGLKRKELRDFSAEIIVLEKV